MYRIPKALLKRLIDHWTVPVGLKIQGEDVSDPDSDPQLDPDPTLPDDPAVED